MLLASATPALAEGWTDRLPAYAQALHACLEGEAPGAFADSAARQQAFAVAVRLRRGAETELCVARPDGRVLRRGLIEAPPADPAAPAFFLARPCAAAQPVLDERGTPQGWLAAAGC